MMIMFYSRHYELSCIAVALWILWFKLLWFSSGWYPPTNQQLSSPLLLYVITLYILVLIIALFPGFQTDNIWATTVEWGITTSAHQSRLTTLFSFSSHGNHNRYIVGVEEVRLLWMRQQQEFGGYYDVDNHAWSEEQDDNKDGEMIQEDQSMILGEM